jgi:hypothetical protein
MFRRKLHTPVKIAWRMSVVDLVAVDIDLTELGVATTGPLRSPEGAWLESSRDLLQGLRVRETPLDMLPDELVEAFTRTRR